MEEAALIAAIADFIMTDAMKPHYVPFIWPSDFSSEDEKNCNIFLFCYIRFDVKIQIQFHVYKIIIIGSFDLLFV